MPYPWFSRITNPREPSGSYITFGKPFRFAAFRMVSGSLPVRETAPHSSFGKRSGTALSSIALRAFGKEFPRRLPSLRTPAKTPVPSVRTAWNFSERRGLMREENSLFSLSRHSRSMGLILLPGSQVIVFTDHLVGCIIFGNQIINFRREHMPRKCPSFLHDCLLSPVRSTWKLFRGISRRDINRHYPLFADPYFIQTEFHFEGFEILIPVRLYRRG